MKRISNQCIWFDGAISWEETAPTTASNSQRIMYMFLIGNLSLCEHNIKILKSDINKLKERNH